VEQIQYSSIVEEQPRVCQIFNGLEIEVGIAPLESSSSWICLPLSMQVVITANLVMQIVLHWQKQKRPISALPTTSHPPRNLIYELSHLNAVHDMRIWNEAATLFREVDICQLNDKNKRNTTV